jgi:hypothetical protein
MPTIYQPATAEENTLKELSNKIIINVIGLPCSGKGSACESMRARGIPVHRPSDAIKEFALSRGLPLASRQDYIDAHNGMNAVNPYTIIEPALDSEALVACFDGLRAPILLERLEALVPHVATVALLCPIEERFHRAKKDTSRKGAYRAPDTLDEFLAIELPEYHNSDRNLPNMIEMLGRANYWIDASHAPDVVAAELNAIVDTLMPKSNS